MEDNDMDLSGKRSRHNRDISIPYRSTLATVPIAKGATTNRENRVQRCRLFGRGIL